MSKYVKKADRDKLPHGPLGRHGGYSVAHKDELIRRRPEIAVYLKTVRLGLARDLCPEGEEHMTTARRIILDRLMSKLSTVRLIEAWLAENPAQILAAASVTGLWLSTNTAILKDLLALGLERRALEVQPLDAILADYAPGGRLAGAECAEAGAAEPEPGKDGQGDDQGGKA